jgi:hypothetical protein
LLQEFEEMFWTFKMSFQVDIMAFLDLATVLALFPNFGQKISDLLVYF